MILLSVLKSLICCIRCQRLTSGMITLPCSHSICADCLNNYRSADSVYPSACLLCRRATPVTFGLGWPSSFITRLVRAMMICTALVTPNNVQCNACGSIFRDQPLGTNGYQSTEPSTTAQQSTQSEPPGYRSTQSEPPGYRPTELEPPGYRPDTGRQNRNHPDTGRQNRNHPDTGRQNRNHPNTRIPIDTIGTTRIPADRIGTTRIPADRIGNTRIPADRSRTTRIPVARIGTTRIPVDRFESEPPGYQSIESSTTGYQSTDPSTTRNQSVNSGKPGYPTMESGCYKIECNLDLFDDLSVPHDISASSESGNTSESMMQVGMPQTSSLQSLESSAKPQFESQNEAKKGPAMTDTQPLENQTGPSLDLDDITIESPTSDFTTPQKYEYKTTRPVTVESAPAVSIDHSTTPLLLIDSQATTPEITPPQLHESHAWKPDSTESQTTPSRLSESKSIESLGSQLCELQTAQTESVGFQMTCSQLVESHITHDQSIETLSIRTESVESITEPIQSVSSQMPFSQSLESQTHPEFLESSETGYHKDPNFLERMTPPEFLESSTTHADPLQSLTELSQSSILAALCQPNLYLQITE